MTRFGIRPVLQFLILSTCSAFVFAQVQNQNDLQILASGLKVIWDVVTNTKEYDRFSAEITLRNTATNISLEFDVWEIHFSCIFRIEPDLITVLGNQEAELPGQGLNLTHVQGDHYYLTPTQTFVSLPPGADRKIKLKIGGFSVARADSIPNWYMTFQNLDPVVIASTQGEYLTFVTARTKIQQWKRFNVDEYNPYTSQERYERNYVADLSYSSENRVVPKPFSFITPEPYHAKTVTITNSWNVSYIGDLDNEATYLAKTLGLQIVSDVGPGPSQIHLKLGDVCSEIVNSTIKNSSDIYKITINSTSQEVDIVGQGSSGVFYGVITLLSLMDSKNTIPECVIVDGPRLEYRGLMLDIVQSFQAKEEILSVIELMATYKLNKLHLSLSGHEGWRVQIPALPELTEFGSQRCHDPSETRCLMPQLGSGPDNSTNFGSGFLTTSDYTEILQLAKNRHVTVIPEITMPGNGRAAILSMKLRNSTLTSKDEGPLGSNTSLVDPEDTSDYTSPQMFTDSVINPCLESTYNFINIIMDELIKLHNQGQQPLKIFHFGGGKVELSAWKNSTACRQLMATGALSKDSYRQYFYHRVFALAANKGLSLGVREDGLMDNENNLFNLSSSEITNTLAYSWNTFWKSGTLTPTYALANYGFKVILAHASHLYLDHPYEPDPEERGTYWGTRFTDTKKLFSYNAASYYDNSLTEFSGTPLNVQTFCVQNLLLCPLLNRSENIVGMEGTLFTTTTRTMDHLHHNLFPRLLALAERAWHEASWESLPPGDERDQQLNDDWSSFVRAVGYRELPRLSQKNVMFRVPPPGGIISFGRLLTTPLYPGLVVQYSYDAGISWQDAQATVPADDLKYRIWLRTRTADSLRFSRSVVLNPGQQEKVTTQSVINYISQQMGVKYTVVDNYKKYGDDFYEASIELSNLGDKIIPGGNWQIYLTSVNVIEPTFLQQGLKYIDSVAKITISHVKGYLYSLGPSLDFKGIDPGANLVFNFKVSYWSVSRYEQMPRWYVSSPGMNARDLIHTADLSFVSPFTKPEQWKRYEIDKFEPWTPEVRYKRNAEREVSPLAGPPIIPTPTSYTLNKLSVNLLTGPWTVVYTDELLRRSCQQFIDLMTEFFPGINLVLNQTKPQQKIIWFQIGNINDTKMDAYEIRVQADSQDIEVSSRTVDGNYYGAMTLLQLALKSSPAGSLPDCHIEDSPRLSYRGMHVDTARNFIPKPTILKLLKVMSLYKLNKLHFHLSDDEGWRLEIPGLEELTLIGGRRCHDLEERECVMSTLGSGANSNTSGSGFYTVKEYKEILRHAQNLHIEVIPEFDTPGHAHTAIKAMRARQARLKALGNHNNSDDYLLDDENDTSHYFSVQYYTDNAVNPCIESTYRFIQKVYTEVKEIHKDIQPLKVFHFGGDEVAKGAWLNSSACVNFRKSGVNLKSLFTQRVSDITKDVALGAWEDGLMDHESVPWNRSLLANQDVIVQTWQNVWEWGAASRAYNLANDGYKVVFSSVTHMYFDHPQEPSPEEIGFYWGTRYTDAFKTFSFMPDEYYMNADIKRSGEPITMDEICGKNNTGCPPLKKPENIHGLQGQLWSETIRSPEDFDYQVFPRLLALAERAWHKGSWESLDSAARDSGLKPDWSRFSQSLGNKDKDLAILDKLNVKYRVPPPGAKQNNYNILTKVEFPGLQVQVKVGTSEWNILQPTQTFKEGQEVRLRTLSADGKRFSSEVKIVMVHVPPPKSGTTSTCLSVALVIVSLFFQVL